MISEHILLALLKQSEARTNADIDLIASFCRLFSVFNEIQEHVFSSFCRIIEIDEFEAGIVIYTEGDVGSDWYILVEGSVGVCSNANSTIPIRGTLKIGDSFGRNALQQDVVRSETVTCLDHVYTLRVGRHAYQELMQNAISGLDGEGQGFANAFLQGLCALPGMHIATSIVRRVFASNSVVLKQREEADGVYFILSGTAAVVREVEFSPKSAPPVTRLVEIDELFSGAVFGIRSLCLNSMESVSVIAKCELTTLFLARSDFYRKVDQQKQRKQLAADYPDDATIRKLFREQKKWEETKKKVVREVLQHKRAKRILKLQY
jgi:CRP-like cAMP-binding protein